MIRDFMVVSIVFCYFFGLGVIGYLVVYWFYVVCIDLLDGMWWNVIMLLKFMVMVDFVFLLGFLIIMLVWFLGVIWSFLVMIFR